MGVQQCGLKTEQVREREGGRVCLIYTQEGASSSDMPLPLRGMALSPLTSTALCA